MKQTETRPSLLLRIRDASDRDAWHEFTSIYRPAIVRMAQLRGLQNADAEDLAQQVLISVADAIAGWNHDPDRARFRTWLNRVTHNAVLNALRKSRPDRGSGNSDVLAMLNHGLADSDNPDELTVEVRREVFRHAAREIQHEFQERTWQAFWLTAVDGLTIDEATRKLDRSPGSIYAARSRVMRRLRQKIQELQLTDQEVTDDKETT